MAESVEEFLARGGKVTAVKAGASNVDPALKYCKCGCNGNYTDHSMRQAENEQHKYSSYYR